MNLKLELVRERISDLVIHQIEDFDIDLNRIANTKAIAMLGEIQAVMQNENLECQEIVQGIAKIFEDNHITGAWWLD